MDSVIITKSIKRRQGRRIWYAIWGCEKKSQSLQEETKSASDL